MKVFLKLTKSGITVFALASALAGYAMSFRIYQEWNLSELLLLLTGLFFVCSGSFALNQVQEWRLDKRMERTKTRPIPLGQIAPWQAWIMGVLFIAFGLGVLFLLNIFTAYLAFATVIMYNVIYTIFCKRHLAFGAVPGAIPGAMPVVIGYSVNSPQIFSADCVYLFLIMFLWQMPHFWSLAIRFKDDYAKGGFPVLPTRLGVERTLYHMGLYMFVYVGVAIASPWFLKANVMYVFLVIPFCIKIMLEFYKYYRSRGTQRWLPFFLWVNVSMLIFLGVPVFDKWIYLISRY